MELKEIHAKQVTVEVRDEATGEVFRRTLPMEYYETANFSPSQRRRQKRKTQ